MPSDVPDEKAGRLEQGLLLAALAFYAIGLPLCCSVFRPGYASYDEESVLDQIQAWREGHPLILRFAWGSLYRGLDILLVAVGGPHLTLLRLPALAAVLAEAVLLYVWLRGHLGERAALWAALADLVCTATFARGASLLGSSLLPAAFLLGVLSCERLRRPWAAALWGLAVSLMLLDYEGWTGALLFLAPYALWLWRDRPGLRWASLCGLAAGAAAVLVLSPDFFSHIQARRMLSAPDSGYLMQAWTNLGLLLGGGDRMAFSAAAKHPWPAPWIWPLTLLGAAAALRRFPWLAWLLACGGLALGLVNTNYEPHRLCVALLAVASMAGAGASLLWRRPWGRVLCLALLLYGCADEIRAWHLVPQSKLLLIYGDSQNLMHAADWLADNEPPGGWDVISGLGPHNDGAFRFLLAQDGVATQGKTPVALIYWDYQPGLRGLHSKGPALVFGTYHPVMLFLPGPVDAARFRAVSASLLDLRWTQISQSLGVTAETNASWLKAPGHRDPWARTVAWEQWLFASLLRRNVDLGGVRQMLSERLVCAWAPDVLSRDLAPSHPDLALLFRKKAESIDPQRKFMALDQRIARY